jgi:hypothetical protein
MVVEQPPVLINPIKASRVPTHDFVKRIHGFHTWTLRRKKFRVECRND